MKPLTYRTAGLTVRSDVPLPAPTVDADPDLVLEVAAARPIEKTPPAGEVWLDAEFNPELRSVLVRHEAGFTHRYLGRCEVAIDPAVRHLRATPDPALPNGFVDVLAAANMLSVASALRGRTSLHASAVVFSDRAIAIAGWSGSGKSTLACTLCASGASLLADDLVCLDPAAPNLHVPFASNHIRLRDRAIAERLGLPAEMLAPTADRRWSYRAPKLAVDGGRLHAIVLPEVLPDAVNPGLHRLADDDALGLLVQQARRTMGVVNRAWLARDFMMFVRLARDVPVFTWRLARGRYDAKILRTDLADLLT